MLSHRADREGEHWIPQGGLGWIPPSMWGEPQELDWVHMYGFGKYGTDPTGECDSGILHVGNQGRIRDWNGGVGEGFWVYRDGTTGTDADGIGTGWRMGMGDSGGPVFSGWYYAVPNVRLLGVNSRMSDTASHHMNVHHYRPWLEELISQLESLHDSDGDGLFDFDDSCPGVHNVFTDRDGDGVDDACDRDRDLHFLVEPRDIKKQHPPLSLTMVTTGRARVRLRALGGTQPWLSGSDMQVHFCDCDNLSKTPPADMAGFHSGIGRGSECEIHLCGWDNIATIHPVDTPGAQPQGYYPVTYSAVTTSYHPPQFVSETAPDDLGGPIFTLDLIGIQGTTILPDLQFELLDGSPTCDVSPNDNPPYQYHHSPAEFYRHCQPLRYRKYDLPTHSAPHGREHVVDWHWRDEPWWRQGTQPNKVGGFLWARAGWFGGDDEAQWQNTHPLHAGVKLRNTDTNGAPWSGGWVAFDFSATHIPPMTTEIEFKHHQPLDLVMPPPIPPLRDLPIVGWIPWETADRFHERIRYAESSIRPGVSASAGVAVVMAGGDASMVRPVLNRYPQLDVVYFMGSQWEVPIDHEVPIDAERFAVTSTLLDGRRSALVDESTLFVALFGGALADGTFDDRLFTAIIEADGEDLVAHWELVSGTDGSPRPGGRAAAVLAFEPRHESLVLIGGEDEGGVLGEIWLFDFPTRRWHDDRFDVPAGFAVSRAAQARDGSRVLLYGGFDAYQSATADLWAFDLRFGTAEPLDVPAGGPGPRTDAAMVADGSGALWLFGGMDGSAVQRNDLWRLDLAAGEWTEVRGDCGGPGCPAGRSAGFLLVDDRLPVVVGGYTGQPGDIHARELRDGRWVGSDEVLGLAGQARDCDGDGFPEPEYGRLCRAQQEWWAPVGKLVCAEDGSLICNARSVQVTTDRSLVLPAGRAMKPALERGLVFALGNRYFDVVRVVRGSEMERLSRTQLGTRGHDLALVGDRLLVATASGLREFDVSDPASPLLLAGPSPGPAAYEVEEFSGLVAVLDADGLKLLSYNGGTEEHLEVIGAMAMSEFQVHEQWFGVGNSLSSKRGRMLLAGRVVFVSGAFGLFTVDVSDTTAPQLVSYTYTGSAPGSLGFSDGVVYGSGSWGPLVDFRGGLLVPVVETGHGVGDWASGRILGDGLAVRLSPPGLRMVELEVPQ